MQRGQWKERKTKKKWNGRHGNRRKRKNRNEGKEPNRTNKAADGEQVEQPMGMLRNKDVTMYWRWNHELRKTWKQRFRRIGRFGRLEMVEKESATMGIKEHKEALGSEGENCRAETEENG